MRAVTDRIALGQAHELPHAIRLLDRLPGVPKWVVGDRGYSSHGFREHIWTTGARPAIPTKRNEEQLACPDWVYIQAESNVTQACMSHHERRMMHRDMMRKRMMHQHHRRAMRHHRM